LQVAEVPLGHSVPPIGFRDRAATGEHGERCVGVVPQKESYFLPLVCGFRYREADVGIDSMLGFDIDVHATQNHCFLTLRELNMKEGAPEIKVGINPHVGLT
jgi:hypothetical protein